MAVISAELMFQDRRSTQQSDGTITYTMPYLVTTNSELDGARTVRESGFLPAIASTYSYGSEADISAFCVRKSVEPLGESKVAWLVTLEYTNNLSGPTGGMLTGPTNPNPLLRPATYTRGGVLFSKLPLKDTAGDSIRNTAGDRYSDLPEINSAHYQIRIVKNTATFDDAVALEYMCSINSDTFLGQPAGHWICLEFSGEGPLIENGYTYWQTTVAVLYSREKWTLDLLEQGYRVIRGGELQTTLANGTQITTPQLLGLAGEEESAPVYTLWDVYEEKPFNSMPIF